MPWCFGPASPPATRPNSTNNDVVIFTWERWSVAGPWEAQATLSRDVLSVRYNLIMPLTDFEDADTSATSQFVDTDL